MQIRGRQGPWEAGLWPCDGAIVKARRVSAGRRIGYRPGMSESDAQRKARLAQALRDNLRRRKAQARDSADAGDSENDGKPEPGQP